MRVPRTSHARISRRGPRKLGKIREDLLGQAVGATFDDVKKIALKLYKGIGTPLSLELYNALKSGDVMKIAMTRVMAESYTDVQAFYLDYCAGNFLRKYANLADLGTNIPKSFAKEAAVSEFFRAEAQCAETNLFFSEVSRGNICLTPLLRRVLHRARVLIKEYLGKVPRHRDLNPRFGPGATSQCSSDGVTIAHKLIAYPECYRDSVPLVASLYDVSPVWFNLLARINPECSYNVIGFPDDYGNLVVRRASIAPKLIRGNRFTTVNKDALTDRGICVEAHTTSVFQLAVGDILSKCITNIGLGKALQQGINKAAARLASIDGLRATIDLKAASDTIAYEFLRFLLSYCPEWFDLLASLRAPETFINGQWVELEKFSSMGNGFTFELETLVFYVLAKATSDELGFTGPIDVYGDDMIVPAGLLKTLTEVLSTCGFTTNVSKTFCGTGFNESCGGDYFCGEDVRPYFLKESPANAIEWYGVANGIYRMGLKHGPDYDLSPRFRSAWLGTIQNIPVSLRYHGPEGYGDSWICTPERDRWRMRTRNGITLVKGLRPVARYVPFERFCPQTLYATALYGAVSEKARLGDSDHNRGGLSLRGDPLRLAPHSYTVLV